MNWTLPKSTKHQNITNHKVYVDIARHFLSRFKTHSEEPKQKIELVRSQLIMVAPLTTVSKGRGLHLLLGRDDVLRTFAVGFLHKRNNNNSVNIITSIILMIKKNKLLLQE